LPPSIGSEEALHQEEEDSEEAATAADEEGEEGGMRMRRGWARSGPDKASLSGRCPDLPEQRGTGGEATG
jgi:hypothetical protein